jgi:hypothetical protein
MNTILLKIIEDFVLMFIFNVKELLQISIQTYHHPLLHKRKILRLQKWRIEGLV